ncbi:exonuclease SbcCD subunit D [Aquifex pyrophilus]
MRLLHLSDVHAGKSLGRVSRNEDVSYALSQVIDFCKESRPDLVLVAGDLFDKANPDNEAKEVVFDFFLRLRSLNIPSVVIAGNHDSYEFMKSIGKLLKVINVHVFHKPDLENGVFEFGELKVACLPYPSERVITGAGSESKLSYALAVEKAIKYLYKKVEDARFKVLLSHLFIAGSKFTRTEREASISQYYAIEPTSIPEGFDYVALGHVHRYQRLERVPSPAYYTGSLFQLDFSEAGSDKFFNFVELKEDSPPHVEAIKLSLKNPLHEVEIDQRDYLKSLEEIKKLQGYLKVRIRVSDKTRLNFVMERVREVLGDKLIKMELLESSQQRKREENEKSETLNILELYKSYFKENYRKEVPEEVLKTLTELYNLVHNGE